MSPLCVDSFAFLFAVHSEGIAAFLQLFINPHHIGLLIVSTGNVCSMNPCHLEHLLLKQRFHLLDLIPIVQTFLGWIDAQFVQSLDDTFSFGVRGTRSFQPTLFASLQWLDQPDQVRRQEYPVHVQWLWIPSLLSQCDTKIGTFDHIASL